jgi:RNA polymerase sigma-70 factor (ECF subfamily)
MSSVEYDRTLIAMAKGGDRPALEQLLLTHAPLVSRHIARRFLPSLKRVVSPDDILQETLLQAFLGIGKFEQTSPESFCAWLKTIADMRLLDALKAQRRQKRGGQFKQVPDGRDSQTSWVIELIEQLPGDASTASRRMARGESVLAIQVGMAGLPGDQREAIRLHLLEDKSLDETAVALNRSTNAVRSLIHRGKQNLAEALGRASLWLSSR